MWYAAPALAQISPGPLARAHTQLEGLTKCLSCHEVGHQTSNAKCLRCHVAIAQRLQSSRGFHARITLPTAKGAAEKAKLCATCHSDHHGVEFALIHWENGAANFDHRQTGYVLEGKHAQAQCRDCHQSKNMQEKFAADTTVRRTKTFLGLAENCLSCHGDEHRGQLGKDCTRCHDNSGWKPAAKFAHERAQFVLTGKHKLVACAKCHLEKSVHEKVGTEGVAAFVQYTGLPFSNCTPCHSDPHRGSFGNACAKCHATEGWNIIRGSAFNHDLTDFPLRGKHRNLACEKCHARGDFKKKLAHQVCRDCHEDAHAGQFARRADQGRCESCHSVEGFVPPRFTLAEHQRTAFALTGAHLAAPCGQCHTRQTAGAFAGKLLFVFPQQQCAACHPDPHAGQFAAQMQKGGCEICHRNESWRQTKFDHNTARFALKGAHQAVACAKCHSQENAAAKKAMTLPVVRLPIFANAALDKVARYRPLAFRCADCHSDVHRGQFGGKEQVRCEKCHQSTHWNELLFMHNRDSGFKLEGAHEKVACAKCHSSQKMKDQTMLVIYKPMAKECAACHR
ncbi:MAG: hypothetical protein AAB354_02740 [candidate division KSB1 bacterium]